MFKNLRLFLKIGRFITRLVDLKELVEDVKIKEILATITKELEGKRIKITKENISSFVFVIGTIATFGGIVPFKEFIETCIEDDDADLLLTGGDNVKPLSIS